ncbi:MAG: carbamoyltransferase HypF [Anaerolineales bacterium]|nr:carbamoyltransferase HypF [Anaerolineales bacterium]
MQPEILAYDLHPGYFSTRYAQRATWNVERVAVQHHHAHIAACMADNGLPNEPVIGLSFDGTGYGPDGAIWGGEVLVADYATFERAAHLEYLPLPGGDAAIRHPWRIAVGYASALGLDVDRLPFLANIEKQAVNIVRAQVEKKLNAPLTSSMGRLFDAVASLTGLRGEVTYEAQAAIELEALSAPRAADAEPYPYTLMDTPDGMVIGLKDLLASVIEAAGYNENPSVIGARFHQTIAALTIDVCCCVRERTGLNTVALSGGVWQNQLLLHLTRSGLREAGFTVYFHRTTPTNDGGLALGQAAVANHIFQKHLK